MSLFTTQRLALGPGLNTAVPVASLLTAPAGEFWAIDAGQQVIARYSAGATPTQQALASTSTDRLALSSGEGSILRPVLNAAELQATQMQQQGQRVFVAATPISSKAAQLLSYEVDGQTYVAIAGTALPGLSIYRDDGNRLTLHHRLSEGTGPYDQNISALARVELDGTGYLFTGSNSSHGITAYRLNANGAPERLSSFGPAEGLPVQTITTLSPVLINNQAYLVVGASGSSSLSVLAIQPDTGALHLRDQLTDSQHSRFQHVTQLETLTVNGHVFVAAAGSDDGISLFRLLPDGQLIHLESLENRNDLALSNPSALRMALEGDRLIIDALSEQEAGLTRLTVSLADLGQTLSASAAENYVLHGSGDDDLLTGDGTAGAHSLQIQAGAGDDIVLDGAGRDHLWGGTGADLFVLRFDGQRDVIEDFTFGEDRLDLSLWLMLRSPAQLAISRSGNSVTLRFGNEELIIRSTNASALSDAQLASLLSDMSSRIPIDTSSLLPAIEDLNRVGGTGDDRLHGGDGNDTFDGGAGRDTVVIDSRRDEATLTELEQGRIRVTSFAGQDLLENIERIEFSDQTIELADIFGATDAADSLTGTSGADTLSGLGGNDTLRGSGGNDRLEGGSGTDTVVINSSSSAVSVTSLGNGDLRLTGPDGTDTFHGIERFQFTDRTLLLADLLGEGSASNQANLLIGRDHNDRIEGLDGFDTLLGQAGHDTLIGGNHADRLMGGTGNDSLDGGAGYDHLYGEEGNDTLLGGASPDRLYGGSGDDILRGGPNYGTTVDGLFGGAGDDRLAGEGGYDFLDGGAGDDYMDGGHQADNLYGREGNDTLLGDLGLDRLFGGAGNDRAYGGEGNDGLFGQQGNDLLYGQNGNDRFFGGQGNDTLEGGSGSDSLYGGAGFDRLIGGSGNDTLQGDFNADTFVFTNGHGHDRITDFAATNIYEKIDLSGLSTITDFDDLSRNHMQQNGNDVLINTGTDSSIRLTGVTLATLDATDFLF